MTLTVSHAYNGITSVEHNNTTNETVTTTSEHHYSAEANVTHQYEHDATQGDAEIPTVIHTLKGPVNVPATDNGPAGTTQFTLRYAKPPVGALRFAPPEPMDSWTVPVDADYDGNISCQYNLTTQEVKGSEDCLFLQVTTRKEWLVPGAPKKPVVLLIAGSGAYVEDGIWDPAPQFYRERERPLTGHSDIVQVHIQYRINIFGLYPKEHTTGRFAGCCGNMAIMDALVACEWAQANIEKFGGDVNNMTLFGDSYGAGNSAEILLASPFADNLKIKRAYAMFAECLGIPSFLMQPKWAVKAGFPESTYPETTLLTGSTEEVFMLHQNDPYAMRSPVMDGVFVTDFAQGFTSRRPEISQIHGGWFGGWAWIFDAPQWKPLIYPVSKTQAEGEPDKTRAEIADGLASYVAITRAEATAVVDTIADDELDLMIHLEMVVMADGYFAAEKASSDLAAQGALHWFVVDGTPNSQALRSSLPLTAFTAYGASGDTYGGRPEGMKEGSLGIASQLFGYDLGNADAGRADAPMYVKETSRVMKHNFAQWFTDGTFPQGSDMKPFAPDPFLPDGGEGEGTKIALTGLTNKMVSATDLLSNGKLQATLDALRPRYEKAGVSPKQYSATKWTADGVSWLQNLPEYASFSLDGTIAADEHALYWDLLQIHATLSALGQTALILPDWTEELFDPAGDGSVPARLVADV